MCVRCARALCTVLRTAGLGLEVVGVFCGGLVFTPAPCSAASNVSATSEDVPPEVVQICKELLNDSQTVLNLLNGVTNRETANQVGTQLDGLMQRIDENMKRLGKLPLTDTQISGTIKAEMVSLTHLAQDSLRTIQRLQEVGAYGSEKLLAVFTKYGVTLTSEHPILAENIPHDGLLNSLADAVDDALYTLRKVHDEVSARDAANTVDGLLVSIEGTRHMLTQLGPPRTEELREALRPTRERVQRLGNEVRSVNEQLKSQKYYEVTRLGTIIERLLSATVN